jgi:hypothetical protein
MEKKKNLCTLFVENFFYPHYFPIRFVDRKPLIKEFWLSYAQCPVVVCIFDSHFHNQYYRKHQKQPLNSVENFFKLALVFDFLKETIDTNIHCIYNVIAWFFTYEVGGVDSCLNVHINRTNANELKLMDSSLA